jgi:hypothetical protein
MTAGAGEGPLRSSFRRCLLCALRMPGGTPFLKTNSASRPRRRDASWWIVMDRLRTAAELRIPRSAAWQWLTRGTGKRGACKLWPRHQVRTGMRRRPSSFKSCDWQRPVVCLAELLQQQVSASQPNRTQSGTSNIPRRAARPELTRVECAARSQVQRTVRATVRSSRVWRVRVSRVASCPRDATTTMAVAARHRSIHSSTRPWEAGCPRPPVVSLIIIFYYIGACTIIACYNY